MNRSYYDIHFNPVHLKLSSKAGTCFVILPKKQFLLTRDMDQSRQHTDLVLYKERTPTMPCIVGVLSLSGFVQLLGDPLGARTQDPNIKSVVLYQLS